MSFANSVRWIPNGVDISEPAERLHRRCYQAIVSSLTTMQQAMEDNHYISMDYGNATVTDINGENKAVLFLRDLLSRMTSIRKIGLDFIDKYLNNLFRHSLMKPARTANITNLMKIMTLMTLMLPPLRKPFLMLWI